LFSLLSKQQYKQQESKRKRRERVREGIKCILSHFKEPVFPRTIRSINTTYNGTQFKVVYDEKEMFRTYEQSKFIDCRVSIYPSLYATKENYNDKYANMQLADLITFDLHKSVFMRESAQIKALYAILQAIKKILAGRPTILCSGNAFHICQPIEPDPTEQIEEFRDHIINEYPALGLFLRLSKLDPFHVQQPYNPSMLLIPGTLSSNCQEGEERHEITIIQRWDGHRPKIDSVLIDFHQYLKDPTDNVIEETK
jgi:hypothetical protein